MASWLLPRPLRQHFYNLYAYCRMADDMADESATAAEALSRLDDWEEELDACHRGQARHPIMIALAETIARFAMPIEPYKDLLSAFRQDQSKTRYETTGELLDYCRRSANPVGRLVLCIAGRHSLDCQRYSDSICTGLQWVNFCQDVARDWDRGRIYLPQESFRVHGCDEACLATRRATEAFRRALRSEVDRAEIWLRDGLPLVGELPRALAFDIWLIIQGGLAIARNIRRLEYDVWTTRPVVPRRQQMALLARGVWARCRGRLAEPVP